MFVQKFTNKLLKSFVVTNRKEYLLLDEIAGGNYEGIKTMHIADFLLSSEY